MFKKTVTLAVGAAGYVLGARAGRERYEQIKQQADKLMNNPKVQQAASDAQDVVADKAPIVKDKVAGTVGGTSADSDSSAGGSTSSAGATTTHA
jgi:hypothetical protein